LTRALSNLQRSFTALGLEIKVTARCEKQLRDGSTPLIGRTVEGRVALFHGLASPV
jgi:hypothetical protein